MPLSFVLIILYTINARLQVTGSQLSRGKVTGLTAKSSLCKSFAEKSGKKFCTVQIKNQHPPAVI